MACVPRGRRRSAAGPAAGAGPRNRPPACRGRRPWTGRRCGGSLFRPEQLSGTRSLPKSAASPRNWYRRHGSRPSPPTGGVHRSCCSRAGRSTPGAGIGLGLLWPRSSGSGRPGTDAVPRRARMVRSPPGDRTSMTRGFLNSPALVGAPTGTVTAGGSFTGAWPMTEAVASGGRVGPMTRRGAGWRRGCPGDRSSRIGEGRPGSARRCWDTRKLSHRSAACWSLRRSGWPTATAIASPAQGVSVAPTGEVKVEMKSDNSAAVQPTAPKTTSTVPTAKPTAQPSSGARAAGVRAGAQRTGQPARAQAPAPTRPAPTRPSAPSRSTPIGPAHGTGAEI